MSKKINNVTDYWDYSLYKILDKGVLEDVLKFHQSTTTIKNGDYTNPFSHNTYNWLDQVEYQDTLPNFFLGEIDLDITKENFQNSKREFKKESIPKSTLGNILYKSFGRSRDHSSKRYPSAGALYPVMPLIYILDDEAVLGIPSAKGVYLFDSEKSVLKKIKSWNEEEFNSFVQSINPWQNELYSNILIGYAINMEKTVAKYKKRGYRHALIEVGLMAQAFREVIKQENSLGDFCWSGFDDNTVTYYSGLNPRLCPVTLLQWFGITGENI
ncbi:nitroreductase family protein [Bacillus wiedmannii]|uniref:nitroreductase family protein n=1 Tax=Bacillus wiedmannii TaxID=1890302 RepID=UPI0025A0440A|nr:nitroreductase family protein [Bacillus wiedmannii]MDM5265479.1 nitroreductase family protein [Bacillus wiedmannii]